MERTSNSWTDAQLREWVGPQTFARALKVLVQSPPQMRRDDHDFMEAVFPEKAGQVRTMLQPGADPNHSRLTCTCPEFEEGPCRHAAALVLFTRRQAVEPPANVALQAALANIAAQRNAAAGVEIERALGFKMQFRAGESITLEPCRVRPGVKHYEPLPAASVIDHPPPYVDDAGREALDTLAPYIAGRRFLVPQSAAAGVLAKVRKALVFVKDPTRGLIWKRDPLTLEFRTEDFQGGVAISGKAMGADGQLVPVLPTAQLLTAAGQSWLYDGDQTMLLLASMNGNVILEVALPGPYLIPARDMQRWVTEILPALRNWGKVVIKDSLSPEIIEEEPQPAVLLEELSAGLRVSPRLRYKPSKTLLVAGEGTHLLEERKWYVRDPDVEKGYGKLLSALLLPEPRDGRGGWILSTGRALHFLDEELAKLDGVWEVYGKESLSNLKLASGELTASMRVVSEFDWFETKFEFSIDDERFDGWALLAEWDKGVRYVKTKRGYVKLPIELLKRLRDKLSELPDGKRIRRSQAGMLAALLAEAPGAVVDEGWRQTAMALDSLQQPGTVAIPNGLQATLRPYQKAGLDWLAFLAANRFGGVLADDMGLGKTLQTISFLLYQKETDRVAGKARGAEQFGTLVVAPSSVVFNWEREITKFAPGLKVIRFTGDQRAGLVEEFASADVVLTNYAILRRDVGLLATKRWRTVVLDEAQMIKNASSQTAECARAIPADFRLALSGTPLENHLGELWSYFEFIMPGFFGPNKYFVDRYIKKFDQPGGAVREELRKRVAPFILRRLKQTVAADLPPKTEMVMTCEFGDAQKNAYQMIRAAYKLSLFEKIEKDGLAKSRIHVLEALLRLRQACCDPRLLPYEHTKGIEESTKTEALFTLIEDAVEEDHKMIVFSQFTGMLDILEQGLRERNIVHARLDGATKDREAPVKSFQEDPNCKVILVSLRAGGTGLNLTAADYVVHFDPWWNPAVEDQATDRAYRIGQNRPVFVYKLVVKGTVEEMMIELQNKKRGLVDGLLGDEEVATALTMDDLKTIFG
jgi:hypothetical protein